MENMKSAKTAKNQSKNHNFRNGLLVGLGLGAVGGGVGGYFVARKQLLKKAKEDIRRARKRGYEEGVDQATKEAQEWIDENILVVDNDDPEAIQKAIDEKIAKNEEKNQLLAKNEAKKPVEVTVSDTADAANAEYEAAIDAKVADADDWDLSIDDEEAYKRSEERSKYLELVEKYQKNPEDAPMHISRKQFDEESYLEKVYVTYYSGDNVFAADLDADNPMDAWQNFGVVNGNDLFTTHVIADDDENDDPNIVYIRNFAMNCVYEVTRTKESYAALKSGEIYLKE